MMTMLQLLTTKFKPPLADKRWLYSFGTIQCKYFVNNLWLSHGVTNTLYIYKQCISLFVSTDCFDDCRCIHEKEIFE